MCSMTSSGSDSKMHLEAMAGVQEEMYRACKRGESYNEYICGKDKIGWNNDDVRGQRVSATPRGDVSLLIITVLFFSPSFSFT